MRDGKPWLFFAARVGVLLSFVGASALAQPSSAPTPRLSPKVEKEIQERQAAPPGEAAPVAEPPAPAPVATEAEQAATEPQKPETVAEPTRPTSAREAADSHRKIDPDAPRSWFAEAETALQARLKRRPVETRARNVILMIGDGMGVATSTAIRLHVNQKAGGFGEERPLPQEAFPYSALVQTYTVNAQTGDGAATATAMMSGRKARSGVVGLDQTAIRGRCGTGAPVERIGDLFKRDGRSVGYVTTARLTHPTPAAGYAASVDRHWEHDARMPADCLQRDIAQQLIDRMTAGDVDLAFGGGRAAFRTVERQGVAGARRDGRDLVSEAIAGGARYLETGAALKSVDVSVSGPLLGLFADGSMAYEHDRRARKLDEPSLAEMAEAAIGALEAASGGKGYFLMVEGGRIGQASHYGAVHHVAADGAAFAEAVRRVGALTDPADTLIIVTADAAHSLAFNGYCGRGSPVPGLCYEIAAEGRRHSPEPARDASGAVYETTGFLNGPGAVAAQGALTAASARDPLRRQGALIPMETQTTSAADVPAYARGPWAHLLGGLVDHPYLFHLMRHAAFSDPAGADADR